MVTPFLVGKNEGESAMLCSGFPDFYGRGDRGGLPPAGGAERKLGFTGNKEVDVVFLQKKRRTPVKEFLISLLVHPGSEPARIKVKLDIHDCFKPYACSGAVSTAFLWKVPL